MTMVRTIFAQPDAEIARGSRREQLTGIAREEHEPAAEVVARLPYETTCTRMLSACQVRCPKTLRLTEKGKGREVLCRRSTHSIDLSWSR